MKQRTSARGYILRFERGEDFFSLLEDFCFEHKIQAAEIRAIGAAGEVELGYYHVDRQEYKFKTLPGIVEVTHLLGNVAVVEGKPFIHVHGVFADQDLNCKGGHVKRLLVGPTLEVFVDVHEGAIVREYDEEIGLKLCTFPLV